jgi:hypothetical protein
MAANDLPQRIPDDALLMVDEAAGTITAEVLAVNETGQHMIHGRYLMTTVETFPLKVPPPPGLLAAYTHTVHRIRTERNAAEAIRRETAFRIIDHLRVEAERVLADAKAAGSDSYLQFGRGVLAAAAWHVWDAMGWPRPPDEEGGHQ